MSKKTLQEMRTENAQIWQNRSRETTMVLPDLPVVRHAKNTGVTQRHHHKAFIRWLRDGGKRKDVAKELRVTRNTLHLHFDAFLRGIPRRHRGMPLARLKAAIAHFLLAKCG